MIIVFSGGLGGGGPLPLDPRIQYRKGDLKIINAVNCSTSVMEREKNKTVDIIFPFLI